ncbi:hypothetical protein EYC80_008353 [Monilinia laxa]|uniref:Rhodopsin domain-containing protein n=1 Tax=Monilinia laxa TaxID=61186 RepID=A0A5N6JQ07_MONLA|nr:hypothetical protein EYC80_008353 [Monilinia laxa]
MDTSSKPVGHYYELAGFNLAAAIILPLVDFIIVGGRLYVRKKQNLPLGVDDWLTIPALMNISNSRWYRHDNRDRQTRTGLCNSLSSQTEYAMYVITIPALGLIKLSVLFFYHRIFCPQQTGKSRIIIITMMVLVGLWNLAFWFSFIFACRGHFSAWWGSTIDLISQCVATFNLLYALSITDFVTDAIVLLIPLPLLWKLRLPTKRKIAVSLVFLLGSVAVAASLTRLVFLSIAYKVGFDPSADEDLTITGTLYWLMIEVGLGLFAACLPTIRFLFRGFSPESVISSIRSALSLHSLRSNRSRIYDTPQAPQEGTSIGSQSHIVGRNKPHIETYDMDMRTTVEDL